tara:strand:+ start:218 stop:832 length:615 start_codon:yes stop_codon:yes gene_type:complete
VLGLLGKILTFEKYSEKHNKLLGLLKQLREIEEQSYVLIDCRNDVQTDLILSRSGFNPENKQADSFGKKIEKIENMMDNLDKERREIYSKLNKLRVSAGLEYSNVNRKLLDLTGGSFDDKDKVHLADYIFRTMSRKSMCKCPVGEDCVKGSEFILTLVNTGKFEWSQAQELLDGMHNKGVIYEVRNDIFRLVEHSSSRKLSDFC